MNHQPSIGIDIGTNVIYLVSVSYRYWPMLYTWYRYWYHTDTDPVSVSVWWYRWNSNCVILEHSLVECTVQHYVWVMFGFDCKLGCRLTDEGFFRQKWKLSIVWYTRALCLSCGDYPEGRIVLPWGYWTLQTNQSCSSQTFIQAEHFRAMSC